MKYLFLGILAFSITTICAQGSCIDDFSIGGDTALVCGEDYTIEATPGMDSYAWSTGSSQSSIVVNQSGTYFCQAYKLGDNLVVNGSFSDGNVGFQSSYSLGAGGAYGTLSNEGTYAITSEGNLVHNHFAACLDHTVNNANGSFMAVNGASIANTEVWKQTIAVTPNTEFQFSTWATSLHSDNPGQLRFSINGQQIGSVMNLSSATCNWQNFYTTWNSGSETQAEIAIVNLNTGIGGNDFGIDDIKFNSLCSYTDQITVTMPPKPIVNVTSPVSICEGETVVLTASSSSSAMTYEWMPGSVQGESIEVAPLVETTYTVIGTDSEGCSSNPRNVVVQVLPLPTILLETEPEICKGNETVIHASSNHQNTDFLWLEDQSNLDSLAVSPNDSQYFLVTGTDANGCSTTDSISITVLEELSVQILGDSLLCDGDNLLLNAVANLDNTNFMWEPGAVQGEEMLISIAELGWVYLHGSHPVCGAAIDSLEIKEGAQPTVKAPTDQVICLGDKIEVSATVSPSTAEVVWYPDYTEGKTIELSPTETTTYYLQANIGNCVSAIDTFQIIVNLVCDIEVPNVFTPNGDGVNDYFKLVSHEGINSVECVILNRWGNVIQEFNEPNFKWDGNNKNGVKVSDGTYFYKIKATTLSGEILVKSGEVQIFN